MIHFDVINEDGDRTLHLQDTKVLVGWINQGRAMTDLRRNWTEWMFVPAEGDTKYPVRENIAAAYEDARAYAATMVQTKPCAFELSGAVNHSDDRVRVFHGRVKPLLLCGYHASEAWLPTVLNHPTMKEI